MTMPPNSSPQNFVPPHNPDLELSVLGAVLRKPEMFDELAVVLGVDAFHTRKHVVLWKAMAELRRDGAEIDLVLLMDHLSRAGNLDAVGGPVFLAGLMDTPVTVQADRAAESLRELEQRRALLRLSASLQEAARDVSRPLLDAMSGVRKDFDAVMEDRGRADTQDPAKFIHEWVDRLEKLQRSQEGVFKTPFYGLNGLTNGLRGGDLVIVAGRPGSGKTAFALNMLEYGVRKARKVGMFSLEMSRFSLLDRLAASGRVLGAGHEMHAQRFRDGNFSDEDWRHIYEFADTIREKHWRVWDRASARPAEIRAQSRAWKRDMDGLDLVVVDYLQLVSADERSKSREREVAENSRAMKTLAMELDVPVVLLCQLNREAEKAKKPLLSHLRESGGIEQDADMILFLSPQWSTKDEQGYEVVVDMAKGRNNATGTFNLLYRAQHVQFVNIDQHFTPGG